MYIWQLHSAFILPHADISSFETGSPTYLTSTDVERLLMVLINSCNSYTIEHSLSCTGWPTFVEAAACTMGTWFIYELLAVILCSARNYNCAELYNFTAGGVDLEAAESSARVNLSSPFFLDEKAYTSLYVSSAFVI